MSFDLAFDASQQAIADAVGRFVRERWPEELARRGSGEFPSELWRALAELGVFALGTSEGDGGACEMVAAVEPLGAAVFPGPIAPTFLATQILSGELMREVARGERVVSLGVPPLMPFAPVAGCFLTLEEERLTLASPRGAIEAVETLGGEPWGRVELELGEVIEPGERAWALHDTALAAYAAAAGHALVAATAEHARTRTQFGKAIGDFQAVAHPLADAQIRLDSAATLARLAAFAWDSRAKDTAVRAAAARVSALNAALDAAHVCHQLFGAVGITLEGPVFHVSRHIRQLVSQAPRSAATREVLLGARGIRRS